MKETQEFRIDGFWLPGFHPWSIHHPVSSAQFVCLDSPFRLKGVVWTEFAGTSPDNYEVHFSRLDVTGGAVGEPELPGNLNARAYPSPSPGVTQIQFAMQAPGRATVGIFDPQGRLVAWRAAVVEAGPAVMDWDGRDTLGRRARPGHHERVIPEPKARRSH